MNMSEKSRKIHNNYCNYMIEKANNKPVKTVRNTESTITEIKRNNYTHAEIITLLAN